MIGFTIAVEAIDENGETVDSFEALVRDESSSDAVDFVRVGKDGVSFMVNREDFYRLARAVLRQCEEEQMKMPTSEAQVPHR